MQDLFGGSSSDSTAQSGFGLLPQNIQGAFGTLANNATATLGNGNGTALFTPLPQTAGETEAVNAIDQGFTPSASQLSSDIAMQTNPYDSSVIDTINRQADGSSSVLQSALDKAGQFGSNRAVLGANDIDQARLQQIGNFEQGEYNNALNNALTVLPKDRQQDAMDQLQAGSFQRGLYDQTQQAPVSALDAYAALIKALPQTGGSVSSSSSDSSKGIFGPL